LIEYRKRRPSPFCCASLGPGKVYEEKAYLKLFKMKLSKDICFSTNFGLSTNRSGYSLDLCELFFGVFQQARVIILTS